MMGEVIASLGGSAIYIPTEEVYEALEKGVIDGIVTVSRAYIHDMGWHKVVDYYI